MLFLAHTKELVEQGAANFERLWSDVTVGRFYESFHDTDTYVVCGSIQSIIRNLDQFKPDDFGYLIIDECHHASAKSYTKMSYSYKPVFLISFLSNMNEIGEAQLSEVAESFAWYYEDRIKKGLPAEKKPCIFTKGGYTAKDVERLILSMPFKRYEGMG